MTERENRRVGRSTGFPEKRCRKNSQKDYFLVRKPLAIVSLAAIPLFTLCVLLLMEATGVKVRKFIPTKDRGVIEISVIRSNAELYRYWKRLGIKGRVVVHAGRYLHFVPGKEGSSGYRATDSYPVMIRTASDDEFEKSVTYANFLWAAVQTNMARKLYTLMPVDVFNLRFGSDADYPESRTGVIRDHDFGAPRIILTAAPEIKERVVLNIDASFLSSSNGRDVLEKLLGHEMKADVITFCLSGDSPDVTEDERTEAMKLLESFTAASNGRIKLLKEVKGL